MNFIFPENFNFKNKIFGILDYQTAIFNILWLFVVFGIANLIFKSLSFKIFFIILLYFPVFLFSLIGFYNESFVYVLFYIFKFFISPRIYLYK